MKWENRNNDYYCCTYPFFNMGIRYYKANPKLNRHTGYYYANQTNYKTLELAKQAVIERVKKECKSFLINPDKFDFDNSYIIRAKYSTYSENTGGGKYLKTKYQWLKGAYIPSYGPYITYAIRFDENIPYTTILNYRLKIIKRHCLKFLNNNK